MNGQNAIQSIAGYTIYNSHVQPTNEFVVRLDQGIIGLGASPQGETISIYEDHGPVKALQEGLSSIATETSTGRLFTQETWDALLQEIMPDIGRNNAYALSLAFFNAQNAIHPACDNGKRTGGSFSMPRICFNVLNGGRHAYTNAVLSDFPEFLLVARSSDWEEMIALHNQVQADVREKLLSQTKIVVGGNPVSHFQTRDNRECIDFLLNVCEKNGAAGAFDLMIDASATDLWQDDGYTLPLTTGELMSKDAFLEYWTDLIEAYGIRFLEDPFHEHDSNSWEQLAAASGRCRIIGDNLYASDAGRVLEGATRGWTHGVIIKPNQSGTVTGVRTALRTAREVGQIIIASHRSISTESTFLSDLICLDGADYIKIGPLFSDFSSVVRLNALIRYAKREVV